MTKKFIVLDTETAPIRPSDKVEPQNMRPYDLGWIVADTHKIHENRSFIIADTFFNDELMKSAYYADKKPIYIDGMGKEWQVCSFLSAYRQFMEDVKKYNITEVWAYNIRFDVRSLNAAMKDYSNGFRSFFLPYNCKIRDIWDYAGSTICKTKKYVNYCIDNGYLTANGNPMTNAETVYRYITNDNSFIEAHTALQDCYIELAILLAAKKRHQKARKSIGQGWRDAAKIKNENPF